MLRAVFSPPPGGRRARLAHQKTFSEARAPSRSPHTHTHPPFSEFRVTFCANCRHRPGEAGGEPRNSADAACSCLLSVGRRGSALVRRRFLPVTLSLGPRPSSPTGTYYPPERMQRAGWFVHHTHSGTRHACALKAAEKSSEVCDGVARQTGGVRPS